jgi:branched-chain amino acid transport system permease protein
VTHGPDGVGGIARPALFSSANAYLSLCVAMLGVIGALIWRLPSSRLGRAMRAVRDNELAAAVNGINVYRVKVLAFAICALLGGIGGGMFAGGFAYVSPDQFTFAESVVFLTMALLGGVATPIGAVIGSGLLIVLPEALRFLKSVPGLYLTIYGLAIILIIRFMPNGVWGFAQSQLRRFQGDKPAATAADPLRLDGSAVAARPALEIEGLAKHFGGLKAVDGVTFSVARGAVHALIGPNGSGKTTTLNVISGLYTPTAGRIALDGRDISRLPPHRRTAAGLGRTFQNIRLFRTMSALDNVMIGAERPGGEFARRSADALIARARSALAFVGLEGREDEEITRFSYGHQRLIEIARALAGGPSLLLLDEPAAGLNSTEKLYLRDLLKRIAATGLTVLIIDHDMTLIADVAEHMTVLNFGQRIADGATADVLRMPEVVAAYLGSEIDAVARA